MAKRLSDTEKWKDDWFLGLKPENKLVWYYILDNCDHAGIWKVSEKLASALVGRVVDLDSAREDFGDRITILRDGEYWMVRKFVAFQYGNLSNVKSGVAHAVRKRLAELDVLSEAELPTVPPTLPPTVPPTVGPTVPPTVGGRVQEKEKEKDKVLKNLEQFINSKPLELFERFWGLYPRKTAKQAALKAFLKLDTDAQARALAAVPWQLKSKDHLMREEQFTPLCTTWLNQGRYDDPRPGKSFGGGGSISDIKL